MPRTRKKSPVPVLTMKERAEAAVDNIRIDPLDYEGLESLLLGQLDDSLTASDVVKLDALVRSCKSFEKKLTAAIVATTDEE